MSTMPALKFKTCLRDGNCLFNATVSHIFFESGDELTKNEQRIYSKMLRNKVIDYLSENREEELIKNLLCYEIIENEYKDVDEYFTEMRKLGEWGGQIEIVALSRMLNRTFEVYVQKRIRKKMKIVPMTGAGMVLNNQNKPIRLLYRGQKHYDWVVPTWHGMNWFKNQVTNKEIENKIEKVVKTAEKIVKNMDKMEKVIKNDKEKLQNMIKELKEATPDQKIDYYNQFDNSEYKIDDEGWDNQDDEDWSDSEWE